MMNGNGKGRLSEEGGDLDAIFAEYAKRGIVPPRADSRRRLIHALRA